MQPNQNQALLNAEAFTRPENVYCLDTETTQTTGLPNHKQARLLLRAVWRTPERHHLLGTIDWQTKQFRNIPVSGTEDAVARALQLTKTGNDVYFACAEYESPHNRKASNATGAYAFWFDLDCGEIKAATGKGYADVQSANAALYAFCSTVGIPYPTHVVVSGGGLHAYCVFDSFLKRETWQSYASKLKRLTKALKFFADDSRTADIASVLRMPGTRNFKYEPPKAVELVVTSDQYIEQASLLRAIDTAFELHCAPAAVKQSKQTSPASSEKPVGTTGNRRLLHFHIERLTFALVWLSPDCDDEEWKLKRIAPLALAAQQNPEFQDALFDLAKAWSSGSLRGTPAYAWSNPGNNGLTGEEVFDEVWNRFLHSDYCGVPTTIGTIYHDAKDAGWDGGLEQFEDISVSEGEPA